MSILDLNLLETKKALLKKEFSCLELTEFYLRRIEKFKHINAFITVIADLAIDNAKKSDDMYAKNTNRILEGIPIAMKDLFCTKGVKTTAASRILSDFVPCYESTVSQKLKDAGTIVLGKANMDEFAMGSANLNSFYGPVLNPYKSKIHPKKKLVPGGSSGGSVAALASGLCLGATGSDTGGSIRQPAAFCGLVGIKPTYGLCSRYGMIAFASSLDQAGPLAHTVADCAIMLEAMAGYDSQDSTSKQTNIPSYHKNINSNIKGLRIGLVKEYMEDLCPDTKKLMDQGVQWLKEAGCEIKTISLTTSSYALPTYYIIAPAEASSNLARYDGIRYGLRSEGKNLQEVYENTRHDGFGQEVKRRIMIGTYVLSAGHYSCYYTKAQKVQQLISNDFDKAFNEVDLILTPTTIGAAFGMDDKVTDPVAMYLNDIFTVTVNLAGLPAISVPAGISDDEKLPLGLQLIAPKFHEQRLFDGATVIEKAANFKELKKQCSIIGINEDI
jgi:aspartyl-tRNA(Asn)/glutamyl-tRNA(Gln) amidotransferase subunit A